MAAMMETLLQGNTMPLVDRKKHDLSRATKAKNENLKSSNANASNDAVPHAK